MINLNRIYPLLGVIAVLPVLAIISHAQSSSDVVERSGLHADLIIEQLISGNLTELNGKYKLRVAESDRILPVPVRSISPFRNTEIQQYHYVYEWYEGRPCEPPRLARYLPRHQQPIVLQNTNSKYRGRYK